MRVLVACEYSGRVRDAFTNRGHYAVSCDLLPSDTQGLHYQGDVKDILKDGWDLLIAFPPCTHLSVIGAATWKQKQADGRQQAALDFVRLLMNAPVPSTAVENPVGKINTAIRKPDQIIQPWMFGDPWTKRTCLWLRNLPLLEPSNIVKPWGFWVGGGSKKTGRSISDEGSYQNKTGNGSWAEQAHDRNRTFLGIADAMADQWGKDNAQDRIKEKDLGQWTGLPPKSVKPTSCLTMPMITR